jgi:hypothetical protein
MRKRNIKPTKFKVTIIGEGETEWYYFNNLKSTERYKFKVTPELPKHSDYKTIIKTARKKRDEGYDLVFCVLDMDRIVANPTELNGYNQKKSKSRLNKNIVFVETMPSIELWFLLHFYTNYSNKIYLNYNAVSKELKKHMPNYDKTIKYLKKVNLYDFLIQKGNFTQAKEFAERLNTEKIESANQFFNYTTITKLLDELNKRR